MMATYDDDPQDLARQDPAPDAGCGADLVMAWWPAAAQQLWTRPERGPVGQLAASAPPPCQGGPAVEGIAGPVPPPAGEHGLRVEEPELDNTAVLHRLRARYTPLGWAIVYDGRTTWTALRAKTPSIRTTTAVALRLAIEHITPTHLIQGGARPTTP